LSITIPTTVKNTTIKPPIADLPYYVAHTPSKQNPENWHSLEEHTLSVANLAEGFARPFGGAALARYISLEHDCGKFETKFQMYLWENYDADRKQGKRPPRGSVPHKQAGALSALAQGKAAGKSLSKFAPHIAQILYGHHTRIEDKIDTQSSAEHRQANLTPLEELRSIAHSVNPELAPNLPPLAELLPAEIIKDAHPEAATEMYLRFVYSCLTDADGLDTEAHKDPPKAKQREKAKAICPNFPQLLECLKKNQEDLISNAGTEGKQAEVNAIRKEVYEACLQAGKLPPGAYRLTVPTGGGKTRSAMAFALQHIVCREKSRVIYVAPFTSILDQNAQTFRDIFAPLIQNSAHPVVLEHHSAVEESLLQDDDSKTQTDNEMWRRLAAENFDAPIIVTTAVQFFESLYSNRPGKCRKLHRIVNSVVILDEAQTLPSTLLTPLTDALRLLIRHFGVTVVFCTATQPDLETTTAFFDGIEPAPQEIISNAPTHFRALRRVTFRNEFTPISYTDLASKLKSVLEASQTNSALCIVNTRRQAVKLMEELDSKGDDERIFHLSTLLCGKHRQKVLETVRQRLKPQESQEGVQDNQDTRKPTLLISTTVVEAGVDVDFGCVYRALAPLPSLIQGAGRCNREGRRAPEDSPVIIFQLEDTGAPRDGIWKAQRDQTLRYLELGFDFDDPEAITGWFREALRNLGNQTDASDIREDIRSFNYPKVAEKMRLIPDGTVSVLALKYLQEVWVPENDAEKQQRDTALQVWENAQAEGHLQREDWRILQPFMVSVFSHFVRGKSEALPGLYVHEGEYNLKTGIPYNAEPNDSTIYSATDLMVVK
jgi:CRISPR-associated endonuclease/helicase Cas3